jgi:hypothetical protein
MLMQSVTGLCTPALLVADQSAYITIATYDCRPRCAQCCLPAHTCQQCVEVILQCLVIVGVVTNVDALTGRQMFKRQPILAGCPIVSTGSLGVKLSLIFPMLMQVSHGSMYAQYCSSPSDGGPSRWPQQLQAQRGAPVFAVTHARSLCVSDPQFWV